MRMSIVYCGFDRDTKQRVAQVFLLHLKIERIQKLEVRKKIFLLQI